MRKRRVFLKVLGVGAAGLPVACGDDEGGQVGQAGGGGGSVTSSASSSSSTTNGVGGGPPANLIEVGLLQDFPFGKLTGHSELELLIGFDDDGFYAMTSRCTHKNCDMLDEGEIHSVGVDCYCHGSMFDLNGEVVTGPANNTLRHFYVEVSDNSRVYVDPEMEVDVMFRAPIP